MANNPSPTTTTTTTPATKRYRYLDTVQAYDLWSRVYDSDANFLQALDTLQLRELLPSLLAAAVPSECQSPPAQTSMRNTGPGTSGGIVRIVDLGCGTGRGIALLCEAAVARGLSVYVTGLDASPGMLEVCRRTVCGRVEKDVDSLQRLNVTLEVYDMVQDPGTDHDGSVSDTLTSTPRADFLMSTLVIEHIPLDIFFAAASRLLRPQGLLLVTNMHDEMGRVTQAGFVDAATGETVRPTSFVYAVEDVVCAGRVHGYVVVGDPREVSVEEGMLDALGRRAEKWVGRRVWFGVVFRRL